MINKDLYWQLRRQIKHIVYEIGEISSNEIRRIYLAGSHKDDDTLDKVLRHLERSGDIKVREENGIKKYSGTSRTQQLLHNLFR